jgi:hypothetical protein
MSYTQNSSIVKKKNTQGEKTSVKLSEAGPIEVFVVILGINSET